MSDWLKLENGHEVPTDEIVWGLWEYHNGKREAKATTKEE